MANHQDTTVQEITSERRISRIVVRVTVIVVLILGVLAFYMNWMNRQLFDIGAENVEATNEQIADTFNEVAESNWREVRLLYSYLYNTSSSYSDRPTIIDEFREELGFTYYYIIDDKGLLLQREWRQREL